MQGKHTDHDFDFFGGKNEKNEKCLELPDLARKLIKKVSNFLHPPPKKKSGGGGGGQNFWELFPINFLAKSGNSKHFSFFPFFPPKKSKLWSLCLPCTFKNSGHYVYLPSS